MNYNTIVATAHPAPTVYFQVDYVKCFLKSQGVGAMLAGNVGFLGGKNGL